MATTTTVKKTAAPKKAASTSTHASYKDMIKDAILKLKDRTGSSRQAIKKYIRANNNLGATTDAAFDKHINSALSSGEKAGDFERPKGPSGPVKLAKKVAAAKKPATKKATTAKTGEKKTKTASKPKTAGTKKTTATKKTSTTTKTTKAKANSAKPRKTAAATTKKTPTAAPAVEDKKPVVLGKTKSGRVTKSSAPSDTKKAIAPKKKATTTKKAAAPKKSATPKKVEAAA